MNVAITRAKHGPVVVGNAATLKKDQIWADLLETHSANVVDGLLEAQKWIQDQRINFYKNVLGK